ncbi:MAG TPA: hypothetical protein VE994_02030 [Terriglobales bacterium]|nr:hypothetical protein [Terriglobales bacterium]
MWSMIVAVGIAAAWFEYSYRRNRHKKEAPPNPDSNAGKKKTSAPPEVEGDNKPLKAASSH